MKDSFNSRYSRTQKSKKKNLILNVLIGVVFVGILAVGASMLLGDDEKASTEPKKEENDTTTPEPKEKSDDSAAKKDSSSENDEKNTESANKDKEDSESVEMSEEDKEEQSEDESNGEYKNHTDESAGPDGSWEPVGTKQKDGEHTNSFEEGSVDWEEKQRALQYATGLSPDEITYWWIGNGGSSSTAKGIVSKAENKAEPFVVMLEWVDGQGWKPTSVERVPGAADNN